MGEVKLHEKSFTFDELAAKYRNFMAPTFEVLIEGHNLVKEGVGISDVTVDTSVKDADTFSFEVVNAYDLIHRDFKWLKKYFNPGKYVEIKMGYTDKLETVFYGLITSLKFDLPAEETPRITVEGMDKTFILMAGDKTCDWDKKKHSDVVKSLVSRYVSRCVVDDTNTVYPKIKQDQETNYNFIQLLAKKNGFEFFIAGKNAYFRKPHKKKTAVVTLQYGKNLRSFSAEVDIADQVAEVTAIGREENKQENFEVSATSSAIIKIDSGAGKTGPELLATVNRSDLKESIRDVTFNAQNEAKIRAEAIINQKAAGLVTGNGESIGLPEIRAGEYIKIEGAGSKLNRVYYIKSARHTINESGYLTSFRVEGNVF